jgi:hypothetical protein
LIGAPTSPRTPDWSLLINLEAKKEGVSGKDIALAVLLAFFSTSISYRFGTGNQLEQIPIILRQLDPAYLSGDFFVSTSVDFGPRSYFAHFIALICRVLPLPWTYLVFTFLTDIALVAVTLWAARRIIGSTRLGAMLAAILVLGVSAFHLGDATQIRYEIFQPASLAIPGALWAVGLGLCGRPIAAAVVAAVASLAHPLYGVQGGGIALVTAFFAVALRAESEGGRWRISFSRARWARALMATAAGGAILLAATLLFWWWPLQATTAGSALSSAELVDILGRFRAPHHYFPSHFRPQDFVTAALFIAAMVFAFTQWPRSDTPVNASLLLIPLLVVLGACIIGTVFTEFWPIRLVFTLQAFRLLSIVKWVGYLLIAWQLALYIQRPPNAIARPLSGMSLLSSAGTQPLVTTAVFALVRFFDRLPFAPGARSVVIVAGALAALLWAMFGSLSEMLFLAAALGLVMAPFGNTRLMNASGTAIAAALGLALALNASGRPVIALDPLVPVFDFEDLRDADAEAARGAAAHTGADAIFVVPPALGVLRIVGRRAVVVDFKAIPLHDGAMREWRERMRFVYGQVEGGGFPALARLEQAYRTITDSHLLRIAARYGATHAVLYADSKTALPEVYADSSYRVVQLTSHR